MNQSFKRAVIAFFACVIFIAGCSDNKSTTGVSLNKEASTCYSEYVDIHGDIKDAYKAQVSTGIVSQSAYGEAHYQTMGASEGRQLPQSCEDLLVISDSCYESYVDNHPDLTAAHQDSGQTKAAFGQNHFNNHGVNGSHKMTQGCSTLYVPPVDKSTWEGASYTDAQFEAYVNAYTDLLNAYTNPNRTESKATYGRAHYAYFGFKEGRTVPAAAVAAVVSSGPSLSGCAGITSSTSKAAGVFTSNAALDTAVAAWISNSATATTTYGEINTWDVSGVTDMTSVFSSKTTFNDDIGCWDVSDVTTMADMFNDATNFNQDIGSWNTASVADMDFMFRNAAAFNQDLSNWTANPTANCTNFAVGATAWLAAYSDIGTTPPIGTNMVNAGCGN